MILAGYLAGRYARSKPLALAATLVFEQSYGGVEGDSASSAELYALLSAISGAPIRQSLAVTGSVNQLGQVQAIGGANEKIEGFFDLCAARGLAGDQGVLIPAANVKHLMLKQAVVDAVRAGKFAIYPIATVDEGIEVLTGVPAGENFKALPTISWTSFVRCPEDIGTGISATDNCKSAARPAAAAAPCASKRTSSAALVVTAARNASVCAGSAAAISSCT